MIKSTQQVSEVNIDTMIKDLSYINYESISRLMRLKSKLKKCEPISLEDMRFIEFTYLYLHDFIGNAVKDKVDD